MELTIDQTVVLATGNGETDTVTGYLHDKRAQEKDKTMLKVITRSATDHVDHCHSSPRLVGMEEVLTDIAFYGAQDDYSVEFHREPIDHDMVIVTVNILSLETTVTYSWTEKD